MKHAFVGLATLLGGFLTLSQAAHAQGSYAADALSYMRQNPAGTARSLGLAGANVALGADFGNLTSNPAGLGFYTKSEFTFTPGLGFGNTDASQYQTGGTGTSATPLSQTANSFHLANVGLVFASRRADSDNSSDWRGGSFALGFTRLADFNQAFRYQSTTDDDHSFFQRLREPYGYAGNGNNYASGGYQSAATAIFNQFANTRQYNSSQYTDIDGLAYGVGLSEQVLVPNPIAGGDSVYRFATPARTGPITQSEVVKVTGSLSQFDLGYGGNYRDRLYIGGGIGIVSLKRTTTRTFQESSEGSPDFTLDDYVKTEGTGINARLGVIYRAADAVRLGASIQTPTYIHLTDDYSTSITNIKFPLTGYDAQATTAPGTYDYSITTPFRANGGAVFLLGKYGFLSTDAEYVGYKNATFNTTDNTSSPVLDDANSTIKSDYKNAFNFRGGLEGRFDIFRARLGYAYYGSPYENTVIDRSQNYFTGGLGLRTKSFFVDAAYVYMTTKELYSPYSLANSNAPQINLNSNRSTVSVTGGLLF